MKNYKIFYCKKKINNTFVVGHKMAKTICQKLPGKLYYFATKYLLTKTLLASIKINMFFFQWYFLYILHSFTDDHDDVLKKERLYNSPAIAAIASSFQFNIFITQLTFKLIVIL